MAHIQLGLLENTRLDIRPEMWCREPALVYYYLFCSDLFILLTRGTPVHYTTAAGGQGLFR